MRTSFDLKKPTEVARILYDGPFSFTPKKDRDNHYVTDKEYLKTLAPEDAEFGILEHILGNQTNMKRSKIIYT